MMENWTQLIWGFFILVATAAVQKQGDVDECTQSLGYSPCGPNSTCTNNSGSYNCSCLPGFTSPAINFWTPSKPTTFQCTDVDECESIWACPTCATCNNTIGSYFCTCNPGFTLSSDTPELPDKKMTCTDIDECADSRPCPPHSNCTNAIGSYFCTCHPGFKASNGNTHFTQHGVTCEDVDECLVLESHSSPCGPNSKCLNIVGSYSCSCLPGFSPSTLHSWTPGRPANFQCTDVDGCANPGNCTSESLDDWDPGKLYSLGGSSWTWASLMKLWCSHGNGSATESLQEMVSSSHVLENLTSQLSRNPEEEALILSLYLQGVQWRAYAAALRLPDGRDQLKNEQFMIISTLATSSNCEEENRTITMMAGNESLNIDCAAVIQIRDSKEKYKKGAAIFITYLSLGSYMKENFISKENLTTDYELGDVQLNSNVVSVVTGYRNSSSLSTPFNITLQHKQIMGENENSLCVYLHNTFWSSDGCEVMTHNTSHTVCSCNHFSSFAILMSSTKQGEDCVLTMITKVGLSLSLLCLFLAILTFLLCQAIKGTSTFLHLQLSLCLFLAHLLFLTGIQQAKFKVLCSIIAGVLHYLYVAAFTWMLLEGLFLFLAVRNLRVVNYTNVSLFKKSFMCPVGYGIPAVIVFLSAATYPKGYEPINESSSCWLSLEKNFIWSFLGPVLVIILINLFFLGTTLCLLRDRLSLKNREVSLVQNTRMLTFKACLQFFILGCSWGLGFFLAQWVPKPVQKVIAYIFTIINVLQGLYIFVIHCLLNHQVQQEYKKFFKGTQERTETDNSALSCSTTEKKMSKFGRKKDAPSA